MANLNKNEKYSKDVPLMLVTAIQLVLLYLPMLVSLIYAGVRVYSYFKRKIVHQDYEMFYEVEEE